APDDHLLLVVVHHIVCDGRSLPPLLATLFGAYERLIEGQPLEPAQQPAAYGDFVEWERKLLASDDAEAHRSYWMQQLSGTLPVLELPTDRPRAAATGEGQTCALDLPANMSARIRAHALTARVNPSAIFLSIYKLLLRRYSGQSDVIVGMPTM